MVAALYAIPLGTGNMGQHWPQVDDDAAVKRYQDVPVDMEDLELIR
jgi:hypothetical protein